MMNIPRTVFNRLFEQRGRPWGRVIAVVLLYLVPLGVAAAQGFLPELYASGQLRAVLTPATMIAYILVLAPLMARSEAEVFSAFRPLIQLDDEALQQAVRNNATIRPASEWLAAAAGVALGLIMGGISLYNSFSLFGLIFAISSSLMYGLLAWTIYVSVAGTRMTSSLMKLPLRVDPLDTAPFDPIGRQSLLSSLAIIGGITISLLLTGLSPEMLLRPEFWLIYVPLVGSTIAIFFLGMLPGHRVLSAARDSELQVVQRHLHARGRELVACLERREDCGPLPGEVQALAVMERELLEARTWPYSIAMLRTLFVSVLIPGGTMVARVVGDFLSGQ